MARGSNSREGRAARSEINYFKGYRTGGSAYDPNDEDAYDMDRDARAEGYRSWLDKERAEGVEPERYVSASDQMKAYQQRGEQVKEIISKLTPEQAKDYKELRKIALKAFEEGENAKKEKWKSENPGKEDYSGKPRRFMVRAGLEAAEKALWGENAPAAKPSERVDVDGKPTSRILRDERLDAKDDNPAIRVLVMARLAYEKDAFLRAKGHFSTADAKPYGHIKTPWLPSIEL